jgi:hypothetical protein
VLLIKQASVQLLCKQTAVLLTKQASVEAAVVKQLASGIVK